MYISQFKWLVNTRRDVCKHTFTNEDGSHFYFQTEDDTYDTEIDLDYLLDLEEQNAQRKWVWVS